MDSILDRGGGILDNWLDSNGLANGINKSILVEILRKSLKGQRSVSVGSGHEVSNSWGQGSRGTTLVDVRLGSNKDLGVGSWGCQSSGQSGGENSLR